MKKILSIFILFSSLITAQIFTKADINISKSKFQLAIKENLESKPIGYVIATIGKSFIGTPYVAHTLEIGKKETLVVDLTGLDCTTFLESTLAFARSIKENKTTFKDYENELKEIRYRNGVLNGYPSRLNYFSDWIYNNGKKGIIKNVSKELGGVKIMFNLNFMTTHPKDYSRLIAHPEFIPIIRKQEEAINKRVYYYIPKNKVAKIENKIHNGDLIAITSNVKGLDFNHVGIAVKMNDGKIHFLHAPNVGYKVQITHETLAEYLMKFKRDTGIMVLRALESK